MKFIQTIAVLSLALAPMTAPITAFADTDSQIERPALVRMCQNEARWPITTSAAYQNGSPRGREQLLNARSLRVSQTLSLCRTFETADVKARTQANLQCQNMAHADIGLKRQGAQAHAERLGQICDALAK